MHALNQLMTPDPSTVSELAAAIQQQYRSLLQDFRIELTEGGVILHGRTSTYYGKQVALHAVMRRSPLRVVANRIVVRG